MSSIWRYGLELKLCMEDFLNSCIQITRRHVKTDLMLSVCKKGTRILKAYGGAPLNTSGEYLSATTEITKRQNLIAPVVLIGTTT